MNAPHNFCSKAIPELRDKAPLLREEQMRGFYESTATALEGAIKVALPLNAQIFDSSFERSAFLDLFRLPFPGMAIEYVNVNPDDGARSNCIALATEHSDPQLGDGVLVVSVFQYFNDPRYQSPHGWNVYPFGVDMYRDDSAPDGLTMHYAGFGGPLGRELAKEIGQDQVQDFLANDARAAIDTCLALNVRGDDVPRYTPPEKLQRKRAKRGKPPLFEYRMLDITPPGRAAGTHGDGTGSHASPRFHLRRGHLRRLASGRVTWVRPHAVGDIEAGSIGRTVTIHEGTAQ